MLKLVWTLLITFFVLLVLVCWLSPYKEGSEYPDSSVVKSNDTKKIDEKVFSTAASITAQEFYRIPDPYSFRAMYSLSGLCMGFGIVYFFIVGVVKPLLTGSPIKSLVGYWIWNGAFTVIGLCGAFSIRDDSLDRWDYNGNDIEYRFDGSSWMVLTEGGVIYERERLNRDIPELSDHRCLAMHVRGSGHYFLPWYIYHPAGCMWWTAPCFLFGISVKSFFVRV